MRVPFIKRRDKTLFNGCTRLARCVYAFYRFAAAPEWHTGPRSPCSVAVQDMDAMDPAADDAALCATMEPFLFSAPAPNWPVPEAPMPASTGRHEERAQAKPADAKPPQDSAAPKPPKKGLSPAGGGGTSTGVVLMGR